MTRGLLHDYNVDALRSDCMIFAASVAQDMYNIQVYTGGRLCTAGGKLQPKAKHDTLHSLGFDRMARKN